MSDWNLKEFDQVRPSEELNTRLLQKIETKLEKKETSMIKLNFMKIAFVATLVISMFVMPLLPNNKSFVDFAGFLNVYASEIETPLLELARQEELIEQAYLDGILTREQYDDAKKQLAVKKEELQDQKEELYEKYKISDDLKLDKVLFSKDKTEDERLKELYLKQKQLQDKEKELAQDEAVLKADYENNKLTLEEFIAKKQELHDTDKDLKKIEDRLEQIEKSSYFSGLDAKTKQDIQAIYKKKQEVDKQFKKLAQDEKKLLHEYSKGRITYEKYIEEKSKFIVAEEKLEELDETLRKFEEEIIDEHTPTNGRGTEKTTTAKTTAKTTVPTTVATSRSTSTSVSPTAVALKQIDQERKKLEQEYRHNNITKEVYEEKLKKLDELEDVLKAIETQKNTNKNTTKQVTEKLTSNTTMTSKANVTTKKNDNGNSKQNSNATKNQGKKN